MIGNTVKPYDVLLLGELNVDLIFDDLSSKPILGTKALAKQMNLTLAQSFRYLCSQYCRSGVDLLRNNDEIDLRKVFQPAIGTVSRLV